MFTGIIEAVAQVTALVRDGGNLHITIECSFANELKVDQSMAHDGVCLTVVEMDDAGYTVTAIQETLERSNLGALKVGQRVNLERCLKVGGRLDGHIVQGHVDQVATVTGVAEADGSWKFAFRYDPAGGNITVEKGSIAVNGVSLTVVDSAPGAFSVAIIPHTYEHTNFGTLQPGDTVNLEFDIMGKYAAKLAQR